MKTKTLSIVFVLCLMVIICFCSQSVYAKSSYSICSDQDLESVAGEMISIPIYLTGNEGLMGFDMSFSYDDDVLTPVSVTRGSILSDGFFEDDIDGTTSTDTSFRVIWSHAFPICEDGVLFSLLFMIDKKALDSTTIHIASDHTATYDGDFNDVKMNCTDITIRIKNGTYDDSSASFSDSIVIWAEKLNMSNVKLNQLVIPLYIKHNTGLMGYTLTFAYDSDNLQAVSAQTGSDFVGSFSTNIGKTAGKFSCLWFDVENNYSEGDFIELKFNVLTDQEVVGCISIYYNENDIISESVDGVKITVPVIDYVLNYATTPILGDSDGDGRITIIDATVIQRYLALYQVVDPERVKMCGDLSGDKVDIMDATQIQRYLAHYNTSGEIGTIIK